MFVCFQFSHFNTKHIHLQNLHLVSYSVLPVSEPVTLEPGLSRALPSLQPPQEQFTASVPACASSGSHPSLVLSCGPAQHQAPVGYLVYSVASTLLGGQKALLVMTVQVKEPFFRRLQASGFCTSTVHLIRVPWSWCGCRLSSGPVPAYPWYACTAPV